MFYIFTVKYGNSTSMLFGLVCFVSKYVKCLSIGSGQYDVCPVCSCFSIACVLYGMCPVWGVSIWGVSIWGVLVAECRGTIGKIPAVVYSSRKEFPRGLNVSNDSPISFHFCLSRRPPYKRPDGQNDSTRLVVFSPALHWQPIL